MTTWKSGAGSMPYYSKDFSLNSIFPRWVGAWLCWEEGMGAVSLWLWETWSSWKFNQSEFRFCFSSNCEIVFRQNLASSKHQTVSWEILPVQSSPRKVKSSTFLSSITSFYLFRDHILVTGGYSWNSIIGKTESLNLTSKDAGNWQSLSTLNTPRLLHQQNLKEWTNLNILKIFTCLLSYFIEKQ